MGSIPVSWCPQRELMLLPLAGLIHMGALMVILRPSDDKRCDLHLSFVAWQTVRSLRKDAEQLLALQGMNLKLVYMGRLLREDMPLLMQGWREDHIINLFIVHID